MSGESHFGVCPKCSNPNMTCFSDWKPYDTTGGYCLVCGFQYETVEKQMTLEEVNELRTNEGLKPLTILTTQSKE